MQHQLDVRQVRRSIRRAGLHAFEATYAPRARLPEHEHASPFFTYVLRGNYIEQAGTLSRDCERGMVMFHGRSESHANIVGPRGTASLNVEISDETWLELTTGLVPKHIILGKVLSGDVEWMAFAVWREFHNDDAASVVGLEEAVSTLCAGVMASSARHVFEPHPRIDRCMDYLRAHTTATPRLADAARIAGVHPMHLAKLFRKRFGYSIGEFVRRQRIRWACEQLAHDDATIATIAVRAGFADHAHFTRTFRRITGCSPHWYRQRINATVHRGV